jgi:hypothetical protein
MFALIESSVIALATDGMNHVEVLEPIRIVSQGTSTVANDWEDR